MTRTLQRWLSAFVVLFLLSSLAQAASQTALVQLVEYVGADYINAVQDGAIVSDEEYVEMEEFSRLLHEGIGQLDDVEGRDTLLEQAAALQQAVADKAPEAEVKALAQSIRGTLVDVYGIPVMPKAAPDMARAAEVYQSTCALCHGPDGRGDGPAGAALEPAPTDFHELARYEGRSLLGLYTTITGGVEGTGMAAYEETLSEADRWALAFYVGSMAVTPDMAASGKTAINNEQELKTALTLDAVIAKRRKTCAISWVTRPMTPPATCVPSPRRCSARTASSRSVTVNCRKPSRPTPPAIPVPPAPPRCPPIWTASK